MSDEKKHPIVQQLSKLKASERRKVILSMKPGPAGSAAPPKPDAYSSRLEFRKALIAHQTSKGKGPADEAISRLQAIGLEPKTGALGTSIVVEGTAEQLVKALDDENVESATFDEEISLIKPIKDAD